MLLVAVKIVCSRVVFCGFRGSVPNPGARSGELEGRGSFSFLLIPLSGGGA